MQTTDFFSPIVDDPYLFGQIAAANALSDVYAMGGEPRTALNIMCLPESMDKHTVHEILRGGGHHHRRAYHSRGRADLRPGDGGLCPPKEGPYQQRGKAW